MEGHLRFPAPVKLEICHITFTVLERPSTRPNIWKWSLDWFICSSNKYFLKHDVMSMPKFHEYDCYMYTMQYSQCGHMYSIKLHILLAYLHYWYLDERNLHIHYLYIILWTAFVCPTIHWYSFINQHNYPFKISRLNAKNFNHCSYIFIHKIYMKPHTKTLSIS